MILKRSRGDSFFPTENKLTSVYACCHEETRNRKVNGNVTVNNTRKYVVFSVSSSSYSKGREFPACKLVVGLVYVIRVPRSKVSFGYTCRSGASCSKLTTSLVNVSLKFQMLISQIHLYFLLKKCVKLLQRAKASLIFSTKNYSVFGYKVIKHSTS